MTQREFFALQVLAQLTMEMQNRRSCLMNQHGNTLDYEHHRDRQALLNRQALRVEVMRGALAEIDQREQTQALANLDQVQSPAPVSPPSQASRPMVSGNRFRNLEM